MDAKQVNQSFDLVTYVSGLVSLKKTGAYFIGACPICGGRDRFQVKRLDGDLWICRKCNPNKYHSAIDFLMAYHKENFKDALKRAGGDITPPRLPAGKPHPVIKPAPVQVLPSATWQADAWNFTDKASNRLMGDEGEHARRYLLARGISKGSMLINLLGFATIGNRPAITIPYLDAGEIITAVKYRFIDELARTDNTKRLKSMSGSRLVLFGLQHIQNTDTTLLFVEGELNAISVLQTMPRGVSVVSAGSEGNGNASILRALSSRYARVVIWTDNPDNGRIIRERMNRPDARLLKSPILESTKFDANEMLKRGLLSGFLSSQLSTQCQGVIVDKDVIEYMGAKIAQKVDAVEGG